MSHILILQWPGSSEADFDDLIRMEDELEKCLGTSATVDGHDFGSGAMNIFIETDEPARTFATIQPTLSRHLRWADLRAAHREATGDRYTVLWPAGETEFRVS